MGALVTRAVLFAGWTNLIVVADLARQGEAAPIAAVGGIFAIASVCLFRMGDRWGGNVERLLPAPARAVTGTHTPQETQHG